MGKEKDTAGPKRPLVPTKLEAAAVLHSLDQTSHQLSTTQWPRSAHCGAEELPSQAWPKFLIPNILSYNKVFAILRHYILGSLLHSDI